MSYNHTFHWPAGPNEVIVTGTFDNWSSSLPLVKTSKGDFELTFPLKAEQQNDDKVIFKFVVDGEWVTSEEYETIVDGGNENNVLYLDNLKTQEKSINGSKIPEAGGLVSDIAIPKDTSAFEGQGNKDLNTEVLPSEEGKQKTLGEPGIVIPANPHEIKEFSQVRDIDAQALNNKLNAEEAGNVGKEEVFKPTVLPSEEGKQITTGEPGIVIPENAQDIKEFSEVRDVDSKALNEKLNGEEKKKVKKIIQRNKQTGEETVISSTPVDKKTADSKTLDPNKVGTIETPESKSTETPESKATETPAASKPAKSTPSSTPKKTSTPAKSEKSEKKGLFRKIKKIFD